ncbi:MAG: membrane protein insertase YidC [Verrucomicrobia bacterium]|nr:membrane protein insertase YidC [Verrucomicrobiota bacterium]MBU4292190.1 membrane protein insertase YidC [Verrucomicrobiota bacterium]MBU4428764.1 membrane protein insertase YidC [Verrucomicrobiota bacterium]MCG2681634.1 membrane protein insertase YidC [Kiritimatiellia bacterium]
MKKQDLIIVAILFAMLLAWPYLAGKFFPPAPAKPEPAALATPSIITNPPMESIKPSVVEPAPQLTADSVVEPVAAPDQPEQRLLLTNAEAAVTVSSWGGGVTAVKLNNYRQSVDRHSGPVVLDFSDFPSLTYAGLPELSSKDVFDLASDSAGTSLQVSKTTGPGLRFTRTFILDQDYQLKIQDVFLNEGREPITLRDHEIQVGPMRMTGETRTMGLDYLGVDALPSAGGEGVIYWAGKLVKLFKSDMKDRGLAGVPKYISQKENTPVDWVAVKSKFFVEILAPEGGTAAYRVRAERALTPGERQDASQAPKSAEIASVSATALFSEITLAPGESLTRSLNYYVGPKKYSILKRLGLHQEEVMDFGWWKPVCKFLLVVLNIIYDYVPNYGIAIILLTILIRIIFWPLTHKSTESMKKMQELQPLMTELRAKYKDNPKKMQEETMGLYKKHKVNPVSGCLPMLIQIPVFVALFVVLRSAIELRFANFLWISDLSEPENLLAGILPYPLNILPIFMAVTMAWQQKLTPTSGDPNQQKMMLIFMPVMMLVMFYKMPSALVLYWSANQVIMIAQMLIQKERMALKKMRNEHHS